VSRCKQSERAIIQIPIN